MALTNMKAIQTVTVGAGGVSTISFSNIPQTYTDLQIVLSLRTSVVSAGLLVSFNESASNLSSRYAYFDGGSSIGSTTNSTQIFNFGVNYSGTTASTFGNATVYVANYTSNAFKAISIDGGNEDNGSNAYQGFSAGLWSNTAAITSITITPQSGTIQQHSTATLYGVSNTIAGGAKAYGGTITEDANYFYHTFLASGTFRPIQSLSVDCLVVAGGGSGGADSGGGGGAGGFRTSTGMSVTATDYNITVGAGGASPINTGSLGNPGNSSTFSTITSSGGGRGGDRGYSYPTGSAGGSGGSGGGGGGAEQSGGSGGLAAGTGNSGGYTPSEGNNGGAGTGPAGNFAGGGGGGAGGAGTAATAGTTNGGNGGVGSYTAISGSAVTKTGVFSSGNYYFAGGGGGGGNASAGTGGTGGGGNGGLNSIIGSNAIANTGGGGGGAGNSTSIGRGGQGGSGIVIIRYPK